MGPTTHVQRHTSTAWHSGSTIFAIEPSADTDAVQAYWQGCHHHPGRQHAHSNAEPVGSPGQSPRTTVPAIGTPEPAATHTSRTEYYAAKYRCCSSGLQGPKINKDQAAPLPMYGKPPDPPVHGNTTDYLLHTHLATRKSLCREMPGEEGC